jgi:hypothetical protein
MLHDFYVVFKSLCGFNLILMRCHVLVHTFTVILMCLWAWCTQSVRPRHFNDLRNNTPQDCWSKCRV